MPNSNAAHTQADEHRDRAALALPVAAASAATAAFLSVMHIYFGTDYVGADNDDVMRLVQVRDLMAGQGWFDLTQYRLGLEGGTPMHWSRLIDVPLANLIGFFSLFTDIRTAEAAALFVWPLALLVPLFLAAAIAGRNFGDRGGMVVALVLSAFFVVAHNRFQPGSIDHHNVQLILIMLMVAGLTEPKLSRLWCSVAGSAGALAIVVGAETVPIVAAGCCAIAVLWAWVGRPARRGARAFGMAFAATLAVCFYLLTPPAAYARIACDAFSGGSYLLGTAGGVVLFLLAARWSDRSRRFRLTSLLVVGLGLGAAVVAIAPSCLQEPYAGLDPLLRSLWLDRVSEARSVVSQGRISPESLGAFYAVPLIALALCAWQVARGAEIVRYLVLFTILTVAYALSLHQVRGAVFANLIAIVPLSALIAQKSPSARRNKSLGMAAVQYLALMLVSLQLFWAFAGTAAFGGIDAVTTYSADRGQHHAACNSSGNLAVLAAEPAGVVSAGTGLGSAILRFTSHRVLSAPYHRNQGGILTQYQIAMGSEGDAEAFLRGAGVTLVAFCAGDPETREIVRTYPDGLYANLAAGNVPSFLQPARPGPQGPLKVFRVLR
ncbi:hypothetical protein [Hoeflea prorocentri]|uniref:Oligosaccharyl transferase-like protein n=1 Tax=Hoeflea prorocentri TaxID=1922333 RepID=A0A9X3UM42_9HYPH|nr:hypothetical protein [Hoeflea prorocentri]MCY6383066.1 hypothetical protein [Hoeflea prorocentri]MDA5400866.1 hypothetical protein [Hoeflea prorocentri]